MPYIRGLVFRRPPVRLHATDAGPGAALVGRGLSSIAAMCVSGTLTVEVLHFQPADIASGLVTPRRYRSFRWRCRTHG
jgi:hypothetical protein